jgi:hypothetical protein
MMMAMSVQLFRQVILGLHVHGTLKRSFAHGRRRGNDQRYENQKETHHDATGNVLLGALDDEEVSLGTQNDSDESHRATFVDI